MLKEETELDKAIEAAKAEAVEKLTDYEEVEVESGPYGDISTEILENLPDDEEVELEATRAVFDSLDDFQGEERHRAESFCLSFFRRAGDPVAINYVSKRWLRHPDQAREYALYLNRFTGDKKYSAIIGQMILDSAESMIDYQWAWAALIMRNSSSISPELLTLACAMQKDGSKHEVIRSLLTYTVCSHGSAQRKKDVRDSYGQAPLLVQLAIIHCGSNFTAGERNALVKTAETHGELQSLMCDALKAEMKAKSAQ